MIIPWCCPCFFPGHRLIFSYWTRIRRSSMRWKTRHGIIIVSQRRDSGPEMMGGIRVWAIMRMLMVRWRVEVLKWVLMFYPVVVLVRGGMWLTAWQLYAVVINAFELLVKQKSRLILPLGYTNFTYLHSMMSPDSVLAEWSLALRSLLSGDFS